MSSVDSGQHREIVIVRRGSHDDEHVHHGGVWKIAFADFMTAMMCLFLVMWLINATDEASKASIASYFNPMAMTNTAPSSKGLGEPDESNPARDEVSTDAEKAATEPINTFDQRSGPANHANSSDMSETRQTSDEHLFSDPYAVLAEIAKQTATLQNISAKGEGGAQTGGPATGAHGGESYRDPFAPDFWSQEIGEFQEDPDLEMFGEADDASEPAQELEAADPTEALLVNEAEIAAVEVPESVDAAALPEVAEAAPAVAPELAERAEAISHDLREAFGADSQLNNALSVVASDQGIVISVTDELNFGMFEIGSAVPKGELVRAMERIARTLNEHSGKIKINGHTDARPFRSRTYDNWRLSTARAHAAYYMLLRGGLDEARVQGVTGYADRQLKDPDNPYSDSNRRIEILLETDG